MHLWRPCICHFGILMKPHPSCSKSPMLKVQLSSPGCSKPFSFLPAWTTGSHLNLPYPFFLHKVFYHTLRYYCTLIPHTLIMPVYISIRVGSKQNDLYFAHWMMIMTLKKVSLPESSVLSLYRLLCLVYYCTLKLSVFVFLLLCMTSSQTLLSLVFLFLVKTDMIICDQNTHGDQWRQTTQITWEGWQARSETVNATYRCHIYTRTNVDPRLYSPLCSEHGLGAALLLLVP